MIGRDPDGDGKGEPVAQAPKPHVRGATPIAVPQRPTSSTTSGRDCSGSGRRTRTTAWWSQRQGALRMAAVARGGPSLWLAPNLLLQKWPAPAFAVHTRVDPLGLREGEQAGLVVFGLDYATLVVERTARGLAVRQARCTGADQGGTETVEQAVPIPDGPVELRVQVAADASCRFSFTSSGARARQVGARFAARPGLWVGARVGLFAAAAGTGRGHADFEWFRVE